MSGFEEWRDRRRARRQTTGGFVFGFLIIAVGTVMLLNTMGILDANNIWDYIPLALMAVGVVRILECQHSPTSVGIGGVMVLVGAVWFLNNLGLMWFDRRLVLPIAIIAVGILLLFRTIERQRFDGTRTGPLTSDPAISAWTMFGGVKRKIDSKDLVAVDAFALFGGVDLDLRPAVVLEQANIEANAIFGGIDIKVPQGWTVELTGVGIFGGYEDKTLHPPSTQPGPRIVVSGIALFGGVSVRH